MVLHAATQLICDQRHNHILQRETPPIYFLEDTFSSLLNISQNTQFVRITQSGRVKWDVFCTYGLCNQDKSSVLRHIGGEETSYS